MLVYQRVSSMVQVCKIESCNSIPAGQGKSNIVRLLGMRLKLANKKARGWTTVNDKLSKQPFEPRDTGIESAEK